MLHSTRLDFLTLVLAISILMGTLPCRVSSAPRPPTPELSEPATEAEHEQVEPQSIVIETIDITPVQAPKKTSAGGLISSEYFYRYRHSLSPRLGVLWNGEAYSEDQSLLYVLGIQYLWQISRQRSLEVDADLVFNGTGRAHISRRWFFSRSRFRPYAKAGGGVKLIPEDGLTTVLKLENYLLGVGFGFEQLLLPPLSLRMGLEAKAGLEDSEALLTLGTSWAW